jgi:hypothetical protein
LLVESTNDNVKDWVGRSGNVPLPVVNNKIEEYITAQQQEFEISIYANGPYVTKCGSMFSSLSEWRTNSPSKPGALTTELGD